MSALRNVAQGFRKVWGMGDEDDYEDEESASTSRRARYEAQPTPAEETETQSQPDYEIAEQRTVSRTVYAPTNAPTSAARSGRPSSGDDENSAPRYQANRDSSQSDNRGGRGGSGNAGARPLRSVAMPLRARDKNIYTLKPKTMDEASLAADYLKTGCAVVVNLEEVERMVAVRIIDFMSGVCYGLEDQGHAMKLGDVIFLFTPGDFEITSDEIDYAENRDIIFKDVNQQARDDAKAAKTAEAAPGAATSESGERRSWER